MSTISYKERPPKTARMARFAWDYFLENKPSAKIRGIDELWFAPNYRRDGPHWICTMKRRDNDTMHWGFNASVLDLAFSSEFLKRQMELTHESL